MTFGAALEALKQGKKVARAGWNGKGVWLRYYDTHFDSIFPMKPNDKTDCTPMSWIGMKTVDNKFVPWPASHTDILAEDWQEVE